MQLKNRLWATVALLHCCNLIWGLTNNNYSLYFLQFLTISDNLRLCYIFIPDCNVLLYIVGTLSKLTRDIVLLLKITQIWVITICVVLDDLDHNTVIIFQKEKGGEGTYKNHWYVRLPIVKVDRNKNMTLNRCP